MLSKESTDQHRADAFKEYCRLARLERADGVENIALLSLAGYFSTASKQDTEDYKLGMRYWSKNGQTRFLLEAGLELVQGCPPRATYEEVTQKEYPKPFLVSSRTL